MIQVEGKCFGCGGVLEGLPWLKRYCDVSCIPIKLLVMLPREVQKARQLRERRRVSLNKYELHEMLNFLNSHSGSGTAYGGRLRLQKRSSDLRPCPTFRDKCHIEPLMETIDLAPEDVIENLMVILADKDVEIMKTRQSSWRHARKEGEK